MQLEENIQAFGKRVFEAVGRAQPSTFNKNYLPGKIMEWSMSKPAFKVNMFRLVDVLPSLRNSAAIARHVNEYLSIPAADIHGLVQWGVNVNPKSLRAKLTSLSVRKGVEQMARMFIAGENAKSALRPLKRLMKERLWFTVDLLGEYSVSEIEAKAYLERYMEALDVLGPTVPRWSESKAPIEGHPSCQTPVHVSVKLSALYSQCDVLNFERSVEVLTERLSLIVRKAQEVNAMLNIDAEDTGHNDIIYTVFEKVFGEIFPDFHLPGIVVQAYTLDSAERLERLRAFAQKRGKPIAIRLVKGAYWDFETVVASQNHWPSPLFAKKESTDAQYERLAKYLLDNTDCFMPAFGSHNVRSLSFACCYAKEKGLSPKDFELQMLFGMAEPIAKAFRKEGYFVRLYVPLGEMLPGMGYLVRRLLENTSNESFLRHTFYDDGEVESLLTQPDFQGDCTPRDF
ncbi:MAG: proline dehydrogenase family protein [Bdellovibrionales bacterium]|nr:proline dehydrogenase family protein [Bdellovibrionales bacterium]